MWLKSIYVKHMVHIRFTYVKSNICDVERMFLFTLLKLKKNCFADQLHTYQIHMNWIWFFTII